MKKLKFACAFLLVSLFAIGMAKSQAIVFKGGKWLYYNGHNLYETTQTHEVYTPSWNATIILHFYLDLNDPQVPDKGINKVYFDYWEIWINSDGVALLKLKINGKD